MIIGTCPILSRYATDLYNTLPDELATRVEVEDLHEVPIDDQFIAKRMFLCVDFCVRTLLPLVMNKPELEKIGSTLRNQHIHDMDALIETHQYLQKVYKKLNSLISRGPKASRAYWLFAENTAHSVQWVIEAAMYGTAVIGPMTANVIDTMAEELSWEVMFPYANTLLSDMRKIQFFIN